MILFFDTETTGVSRYKDHLVQIAWVLTDTSGKVHRKQCHVIRPQGFLIPPSASRIHGITTEAAQRTGLNLSDVLKSFASDARQATTIVAHNVQFDFAILQTSFQFAGLPFPLQGKSQICTMKTSTNWCALPKTDGRPGLKYPRLDELHYSLFKKGFDNAHDALADTLACMRCYFELARLGVVVSITGETFKDQLAIRQVAALERERREAERRQRADIADREMRRAEVEKQQLRVQAEKEAALAKAKRVAALQRSDYVSSLTNPGPFVQWWIWSSIATAIAISGITDKGRDGGLFFGAAVLGLFVAHFAREWDRERNAKHPTALASIAEFDRKQSGVATSPRSSKPAFSPTQAPITAKAAPTRTAEVDSSNLATTRPAKAAPPRVAEVGSSNLVTAQLEKAAPPRVAEVGNLNLATARPANIYRNQLCDPMNVARLKLMLNSLPEYPGFAVVSGESLIRNVVVHGTNVQRAVKGFLGWAAISTDPDWDVFLSHGFSPAILSKVNSNPDNAGKERDLGIAENSRLHALTRSRNFDGAKGLAYISGEYGDVATPTASSAPLRSPARPIQSVTAKETKSVAEYVAKKNAAEMIKLAGVPPVKVVADTAKPVQRTDPIIQHRSELTEKVADIAQQRPQRPQVAPSFPNLKGLAWIKECAHFYAQDVADFGVDQMEFIGRQTDRTHWKMCRQGSDAGYLSACVEVDLSNDIEIFGDDQVDLVKRVAKHYFDDHEWLYTGRFKEPATLTADGEIFGVDFVAMADRVISFVYATNLIKDIQPLPFSVGAKVSHKIKGEAFGIGEILKRNDQYLTVKFPAVQKQFELITATAGDYLGELPNTSSSATQNISNKPTSSKQFGSLKEALAANPLPGRPLGQRTAASPQAKEALKALMDAPPPPSKSPKSMSKGEFLAHLARLTNTADSGHIAGAEVNERGSTPGGGQCEARGTKIGSTDGAQKTKLGLKPKVIAEARAISERIT